MTELFLQILNMGITAGWVALAVIIIRPILSRGPKYLRPLLWGIVGLRLLLPFSIESVLSLLPSSETVPPEIIYSQVPTIHTGVPLLNSAVNPIISHELAPEVGASVNPVQIVLFVASIVWVTGIAAMLIYATASYIKIRLRVRESVLLEDNIYICDRIGSPFILGIIKPRIYLPSHLTAEDKAQVIAHETAHIIRRDHIWKPLGFILLTVYWFNPLLWVAYILLCRDIELACDEKVIKTLGSAVKKDYSEALLRCSMPKNSIAACPLAFGETGVKSRIKSVLNYKKPAFWVIAVSVIVCIAVAVCFLTNPKSNDRNFNYGIVGTTSGAEFPDVEFEYLYGSINSDFPHIGIKWTNNTDKTLCFGEPYSLFRGETELHVKGNMAWDEPLYTVAPGDTADHCFNLDYFDIEANGRYCLESKFYFAEDETKTRYKAFVSFIIDRQFSFVGKHYKLERVVFDDGMYSSVLFNNQSHLQFAISDDNCHLMTNDHPKPSISSSYYDLGELERVTLSKELWDELLPNEIWDGGYTAKALRENNRNAFRVIDERSDRLAFLLEQKNGEIYIAYGYASSYSIRWIFKMAEMDFDHLYWDKNEALISYVYEDSPDPISPVLILYPEIGKFRFSYSSLSSYIPMGNYVMEGDKLILTTDELTPDKYVFKKVGDSFVFDSGPSHTLPKYKYHSDGPYLSPVPDGAEFKVMDNLS